MNETDDRALTVPTPASMRALAIDDERDAGFAEREGLVGVADALRRNAAALRSAADQIEAVHGALWGGRVTTSAVVRVANARQFLPRSTTETAPQEDRDD